MKLILSGKYQFGEAFAYKQYGVGKILDLSNSSFEDITDDYKFVINTEEYLKKCFEERVDYKPVIEKVVSSISDLVIVATDIGNGLIPLEKKDRDFREYIGHFNCFLAERSEEVYRVFCGIGEKLK